MKNKTNPNQCNISLMPPSITDEDISALFAGILEVVKKKFELECKQEVLSLNSTLQRVTRELDEKKAECIRLKNELLYLKSKP